jgi:hypothetical protein
LVERHDLPMKLALQVSRDEIGLREALRRREESLGGLVARRISKRTTVLGAIALILASMAIGAHGLREWQRHVQESRDLEARARQRAATSSLRAETIEDEPSAARSVPSTIEVTKDEQGRIQSISAMSPRAVLLAFCGTDAPSSLREPLEADRSLPRFLRPESGLRDPHS